jgi:hypothetical protein
MTAKPFGSVGLATLLSKTIRAVELTFLFVCGAQAVQSTSPQEALPVAMVIKGLEQPGASGRFSLPSADIKAGDNQLDIRVPSVTEPVTVRLDRALWKSQLQPSIAKNLAVGDSLHAAQFFRRLQPFGLAQSITLTRQGESTPWLGIQQNAQSGQKILANWSVLHTQGRWWLQESGPTVDAGAPVPKLITLDLDKPTTLRFKGTTWCLHAVNKPQRSDMPALLDWVLVQQLGAPRK